MSNAQLRGNASPAPTPSMEYRIYGKEGRLATVCTVQGMLESVLAELRKDGVVTIIATRLGADELHVLEGG